MNFSQLNELLGSPVLIRKFIKKFILHTPEMANKMKDAIERNDFDQFILNAHSLKSLVSYLGPSDLLDILSFFNCLDPSTSVRNVEIRKKMCTLELELQDLIEEFMVHLKKS